MAITAIFAIAVIAALALWRMSVSGHAVLDKTRADLDKALADLGEARSAAAAAQLDAERRIAAAAAASASLTAEQASQAAALRQALADAETRIAEARALTAERDRALEQSALALAQTNEALASAREEGARLQAAIDLNESERASREQALKSQLQNLAGDILRQNSADFKAQNEERLREILTPLKADLDDFRKTVANTYSNEARERFSLAERIRELTALNDTISREARDLTRALRGNNQVQGDWGEMILEGILEQSGLQQGREYFMQATVDDSEGQRKRPDAVVRYPDGRCVVIDSKVSLTAFVEYSNADDPKARAEASARHLRSVRSHIDELTRKRYNELVGEARLDFVMMFIPNEAAYMASMRIEPGLWQEAYDKGVLIVSPTHLVSGLRLIEQLWQRDKVTRNAIRIAEDAGKMYDKFADFTRDMERISTALASATKAHTEAMKKLSTGTGNLVKRADDLRALGIKAGKQLAASVRDTAQGDTPGEDNDAD